ncbi:MAG: hypothetical protein KC609_00770 [Myxococcales bacterium]|nr:hypothetical protein [Myxococcales bacterium]
MTELNANLDLGESLRGLVGHTKSVELYLRGGHALKGLVTAVGDHTLVLSQLAGREYFDAVVRLDSIIAFSLQTRFR